MNEENLILMGLNKFILFLFFYFFKTKILKKIILYLSFSVVTFISYGTHFLKIEKFKYSK